MLAIYLKKAYFSIKNNTLCILYVCRQRLGRRQDFGHFCSKPTTILIFIYILYDKVIQKRISSFGLQKDPFRSCFSCFALRRDLLLVACFRFVGAFSVC